MSHHNTSNPFPDFGEFKERITKLGPTRQFPDGHLTKDDEGEIKIGITHSQGKIVMDFGTPTHWIGFTPEQARQVAATLIDRAKMAENAAELEKG